MTHLLAPGADGYPTGLLDLPSPPPLYVRGALPRAPGIAVVGTRAASDGARAFTRELVIDLAAAGFAIWSGGATGIDAAAHVAALEAGGPTVVVTGGGLDQPYPAEHAPLFQRVLDSGGALASRVADHVPPAAPFFLARNAVLAAATLATVVVEAPIRSGARSTAAAARRLRRAVCVVPHAPWHSAGRGCIDEIRFGAVVVASADDVVAAARSMPPVRRRTHEPARALASKGRRAQRGAAKTPPTFVERASDGERAVLGALSKGLLHVDQICEITNLSLAEVSEALLTLTLEAVVVEGPAGSFRRARRFVGSEKMGTFRDR